MNDNNFHNMLFHFSLKLNHPNLAFININEDIAHYYTIINPTITIFILYLFYFILN